MYIRHIYVRTYVYVYMYARMSVISPELVQEVETRMNRQYIPPPLPVVAARQRIRKPQIPALPTVQESHRVSGKVP